MTFPRLTRFLPNWKNAWLAVISAILLILAFPDFEYWFMAWFALVPLFRAIEREKASAAKSFVLGWAFGTIFFFGTCWWLTFAPITYASFPPLLAYFLMLCVALMVGVFPATFAAILSVLLKRFGSIAILSAPFIWVFTEFLRYWITGNNWNAIGYSQAFSPIGLQASSKGGVYLVGYLTAAIGASVLYEYSRYQKFKQRRTFRQRLFSAVHLNVALWAPVFFLILDGNRYPWNKSENLANVVAVQPNVPMSGLTLERWRALRQRHVMLAETALKKLNEQRPTNNEQSTTVIFPESPMNFEYEDDPETKEFIDSFAARNNVSILFNSAEPDGVKGKFFNSAVMVSPEGREVAQYDKIYLLPFGEFVPAPLQSIVPAFVGSFSAGKEYDLLPLGDAKAGVMICFESHFGQLSREYVRNGADVLIEMTNDGYLGPTPILRQHLANAVFRAVETNRPVLRVTNVGITAYINEKGEVLDPATPYQEDTRIWSVSKSDGTQTFYVKYGDWFAWLCTVVTLGLWVFGLSRQRRQTLKPSVQ